LTEITSTLWDELIAGVRAQRPELSTEVLAEIRPGSIAGGELAVYVDSSDLLDALKLRYTKVFVETLQSLTGHLIGVRFVGDSTNVESLKEAANLEMSQAFQLPTPSAPLNEENVFDNLVVGPCNRLAHAACLAVCDSPGRTYNPMFIHGNSGLGKTHLLQACCWRISNRNPDAQILYLSCEAFINDFIEAVEEGRLHSFRYRYRHIDLLVIDDIHFLAKHEQTQDEFFHTFNTLYQTHRQIIVSADVPPSGITSVEERLITRFNWGLVARVEEPCFETRVAILRKKSRLRAVSLPEDVIAFIASRIDPNPRALEGAVVTLRGMSSAADRPIDLEMAQELFGERPAGQHDVSVDAILEAVIARFDVRLGDLQGRSRSRSFTLPRQVCMYLIYAKTRHSLKEIGGYFGGRDHTTVLHACRTIKNLSERDPDFRSTLGDLEDQLMREASK
jgi:chromosomal replication initiator protein